MHFTGAKSLPLILPLLKHKKCLSRMECNVRHYAYTDARSWHRIVKFGLSLSL